MREEERNYKRLTTYVHAVGKLPDGTSFPCQIVDITPQGFAFVIENDINVSGQFELVLSLAQGEKTCFRCQFAREESMANEALKKICVKIIYGAPADHMRLYQFYTRMKEGQ